ncbi:hypothetical protein DFH09DRAFT_1368397 [Mycena vulgaris]|nr:hypothetical protein DFH09DRAFT_1368397 [Mycena vulgaris]
MPRPHTPDTARPIYSTHSSPSYHDPARTPRVSDYNQQLVHHQQLLPVPWLLNEMERPRNELPPHAPATAYAWSKYSNSTRRARIAYYGQPDDVRVGQGQSGEFTVYDGGVPLRFLNAQAPEFRPSGPGRPASAHSVSSSRSVTSTASSSASGMSFSTVRSSGTSATSVSGARASSRGKSPAPTLMRSPSTLLSPIPVFPTVDPGERAYKAYRERLRREPDVTKPIHCILETGVGSYELTQHIAILANRLSAHAPCGPEEFRARLRAEALGMFSSYWSGNDGPWRSERIVACQYLQSRGINIAAFMGSLFRYGLISHGDVHHCLDILLSTGLSFMKLQAAHAAFVHCGERICAGDAGLSTALVRTRLVARGPDGRFVWGPHDESHALLEDLLDNLDRWFASQDMSRIRSKADVLSPPSATARSRRASPAASQMRLPTGYGH